MATGNKLQILQNVTAGMSEDDRRGQAGSILYSENLNLHGNSGFIEPTQTPTKMLHTNSLIKVLYRYNNVLVAGCNNGRIYTNIGGDTEVASFGSGEPIKAFFKIGTRLYMMDNNKTIFSILLSNIIDTTWTLGTQTISGDTINDLGGKVPIIELGDKIIFASNNKIYSVIASSGSTLSVTEYDFGNEEINGITYLGGYVKIYDDNGDVFLWDTVSNEINERYNIGLKVRIVQQIGGIDYLITGQPGADGLYYMSGYSPVVLQKRSYSRVLDYSKFEISSRSISSLGINDKNIYMGTGVLETSKEGVLLWGSKLTGFPKGSVIENTKSSAGYSYDEISGVYHIGNYLYIAYDDSINTGIDQVELCTGCASYQKQANLYYRLTDFGDRVLENNINRLEIRIDGISATKNLKIYLNKNSSSYELHATISEQPIDGVYKTQIKGKIQDLGIMIEWDCSLYVGVLDIPPRLYGINIYYD